MGLAVNLRARPHAAVFPLKSNKGKENQERCQWRVSPTHEIRLLHHLNKLTLPTVLREHEKIARQCAAEGADHIRDLARLIELEPLDREGRMISGDVLE